MDPHKLRWVSLLNRIAAKLEWHRHHFGGNFFWDTNDMFWFDQKHLQVLDIPWVRHSWKDMINIDSPPLLLMLLLNFARCWLYFKPSSGWWFGTYFIFPYIGSRCHHAQHTPHKGTIHGTKCHACHAKTHLVSQPRARVISEERRRRHIRGKFPRHNRGAFPYDTIPYHTILYYTREIIRIQWGYRESPSVIPIVSLLFP